MIGKENFHTHTTFCDGKNTGEDMVLAAIERKFSALGFSGHSYTAFDESYCMSKVGTKAYIEEIKRLQKLFDHKISIFCGVEQDFYSEEPVESFDYAIGSVHYIKKDGMFLPVDESAELIAKEIKEFFAGDSLAFAKVYFETVARVLEKTGANIIGHFDLLTKFNEKKTFFDTASKQYRYFGISAIETLLPFDKPFEINTGAMYRGLRFEPYPSMLFLKEIQKRGGKIILSSDSHDCASLGFAFEEIISLIKELGFRSRLTWTSQGFEEIGL